MINTEFVGENCAVCGDVMLDTNSNFNPTWSDKYDNVVCYDCAVAE